MGLASFFRNIGKFITMIVRIVTHPFELIQTIIAGVIISILFVIHKILSYPPLIVIPFVIWFLVMKVLVLIIYSVIICGVLLLISIILLLISIVNYMTKGKLSKLVLCQNSPNAWYQIPNFHLGNKFDRSLFCKTPCATGFVPDEMTKSFCGAIKNGEPSYCPHAEIMRILSSYSRKDRTYMYPNFSTLTLSLANPKDKESELKKYFVRKQQYFQKCNSSLGNYEPLALSVCMHLDMLKATKFHGLNSTDILRLEDVCRQSFCNSKNKFFFCGGTVNGENSLNDNSTTSVLVKSIASLLIISLLFAIALAYTYNFTQSV